MKKKEKNIKKNENKILDGCIKKNLTTSLYSESYIADKFTMNHNMRGISKAELYFINNHFLVEAFILKTVFS